MVGSPTALAKPVKMAWPRGPAVDRFRMALFGRQGQRRRRRHQQHIAAGELGIAPVLQRVDLDQDLEERAAAGRRPALRCGRWTGSMSGARRMNVVDARADLVRRPVADEVAVEREGKGPGRRSVNHFGRRGMAQTSAAWYG